MIIAALNKAKTLNIGLLSIRGVLTHGALANHDVNSLAASYEDTFLNVLQMKEKPSRKAS